MGLGELILIAIVAIVIYAVYSISKTSAEKGSPSGQSSGNAQTPPPGQGPSQFDGGKRKKGYAKWVGGGLGWAFGGGPMGAILGLALGTLFDEMNAEKNTYRGTPRGDFAMSLLVLSAAVMKADNKVVRAELDYVRSFFINQFGVEEGNRLITMLNEILKQDINVQEVSVQVGQYTDYAVKLQLLHYLFGIAAADNVVHPDEVEIISVISRYMGISEADYSSIKAMFVRNTGWAYDVLEITSEASNDEVKKAYREMAKKHHPDKVANLGEDVKRAATEKFQKISAAYEEIKKQRGIV